MTCFCCSQIFVRSSPSATRACIGIVSVPISTVTSGLARRLRYQSGSVGAPPFDAKTATSSPTCWYTTGLTRSRPDFAPVVCSNSIGAPSKPPPTLPPLVRNSSMMLVLKSLTSLIVAVYPHVRENPRVRGDGQAARTERSKFSCMVRDEKAVAQEPPTITVGLEPLGSEVLLGGSIVRADPDEVVLATSSLLGAGTRAFAVIYDGDHLPVVGIIEIVDHQVVVDDVAVELRARFVHLSNANADRLAE